MSAALAKRQLSNWGLPGIGCSLGLSSKTPGGAGGGGGFSPLSIDGCELWLDAEDADTITGSASLVDQWDDKSAAGNNVIGTGGARPSQTTINSLNAIRFDNGEQLTLASGSVTGLDGADMTIFVIGNKQFDEADSWPGVINRSNTGWSTGWRMASTSAGGADVAFSGNAYTTDVVVISTTATGADAFHLWAGSHTNTGPSKIGYLNNEQTATDASGDITGASANSLTVGTADATVTYNMFGSIGEIIIYNTVLSTEDRLAVSEYLAEKWGITLP